MFKSEEDLIIMERYTNFSSDTTQLSAMGVEEK